MTQPIVLIIGTRPEAIKMIPVYFAAQRAQLPVILCSTSQHTDLLQEVFFLFNIIPDIDLGIMRPGQDLTYITCAVLIKIQEFYKKFNPSLVLVQGDTTTCMAASLAAFYEQIPICHIEAGLRTAIINNPFPEEMNRRLISMISSLHCAPTSLAYANLLAEGIDRSTIHLTGNPVVDAVRLIKEKINNQELKIEEPIQKIITRSLEHNKQLVLLTVHRRESFKGGLDTILNAVKEFAQENPQVQFVYPFHPNPYVLQALKRCALDQIQNIFLTNPLAYKDLVYILLHTHWVATDSGGICEEAISLGKHVLILRNTTERPEAIWSGLGIISGTDKEQIIQHMRQLLTKNFHPQPQNVFGDGYAAEKIIIALQKFLENKALSFASNTFEKKLHEKGI
jgi:UDP-N-acetylglucosamine 2-epimerase (non-hydrolysing)